MWMLDQGITPFDLIYHLASYSCITYELIDSFEDKEERVNSIEDYFVDYNFFRIKGS